ncbi:MAG: cation diffusion facilitator family transporter [Pseudomonadota bacterium]
MSDQVKHITMPTDQHSRLMRSATYAAVATAFTLIVVKFFAWQQTGSLSLLATLIDSLLDAAASLINLFAVRQALVPADKEHRFGHGKAEPLAALGQAAFITGSAVFLVIEALSRLAEPKAITHGPTGIAVMIFALTLTLCLALYQVHVIRRTGSLAISADLLNYKGDILVNLAVIIALVLGSTLGWRLADPLFGLGIAAFIIYNAFLIARSSLHMLMDHELPDDQRENIKAIILDSPEVLGIQDLRTRASGPQTFIQFHIEMDGRTSLDVVHEIAGGIEKRLIEKFPGAEVIIHQDPYPDSLLDVEGKKSDPHQGVDGGTLAS